MNLVYPKFEKNTDSLNSSHEEENFNTFSQITWKPM